MAVEEIPQDKPKSKKLLIIIVAAVAVLLIGGGVAWWMMGSDDSGEEQAQVAQAQTPAEAPVAYVNLSQPFVFNVAGKNRDRMVQIKVQLMVRGSENEEIARYHSPLIESTLLATFAAVTMDQLRAMNGRTELRDRATEDIKSALKQVVGQPVIERVLFTDFVIQ